MDYFIGIVEDRDDPLQLGRVKVRVLGVHSLSKNDLPTSLLPWATPIQSITSAALLFDKKTVGLSPTGLLVGSTVIGFFLDGANGQLPMILGTIAGLPNGAPPKTSSKSGTSGIDSDVPFAARGIKNFENKLLPMEPDSKFAQTAKYPKNTVMNTEGGILIELDSTNKEERIHIRHPKGTYIQIDKDGSIVIKTVKDTYILTAGNRFDYVGNNYTIKVDGKIDIKSDVNITLSSPRIDEEAP